jgi:PsbP
VTEEPNAVTFRHYNETGNLVVIADVMLQPRPENIETSEEFMKSLMNRLRGVGVSEIHSINGTSIIGGKPAYMVDYSEKDENTDTTIHHNNYFMVDTVNDMMYSLSFYVNEEVYAEYSPIIDKMANSFKIL